MEVTNDLLTMDDLPGQCGRPIVQTIWDVTCRNIHTPAGCDIWIPKYGPNPHIHKSGPMRIPEVPGNPILPHAGVHHEGGHGVVGGSR